MVVTMVAVRVEVEAAEGGGTSSSMYSRKWIQNSSNCRSAMPCTHLGMSSSTSPARAIFSSCVSEARRLAIKASSIPPDDINSSAWLRVASRARWAPSQHKAMAAQAGHSGSQ